MFCAGMMKPNLADSLEAISKTVAASKEPFPAYLSLKTTNHHFNIHLSAQVQQRSWSYNMFDQLLELTVAVVGFPRKITSCFAWFPLFMQG